MDEWSTRFPQDVLARVDAFVAEHPEYTRKGVEQPGQGATNHVLFARRGDELVVLKVFCEAERKDRECFALRHWRDTGLVPELIWEADPVMIVMSYVPGVHLHRARELEGEAVWRDACRETGKAIGSLTSVPLSAADRIAFECRFYEGAATLEAYLGRILELGRSIHAIDPDFRDAFWGSTLDFIEAQLEGILAQPRVLYHQDAGNLHVRQGCFMGFYDLEMCRVGCGAMQLGSSLGLAGGLKATWELLRDGWEAATNSTLGPQDLRAAAAANYLLAWREISRYMSYDGTPGTGYAWASPANPIRYRVSIEAVAEMLELERR